MSVCVCVSLSLSLFPKTLPPLHPLTASFLSLFLWVGLPKSPIIPPRQGFHLMNQTRPFSVRLSASLEPRQPRIARTLTTPETRNDLHPTQSSSRLAQISITQDVVDYRLLIPSQISLFRCRLRLFFRGTRGYEKFGDDRQMNIC